MIVSPARARFLSASAAVVLAGILLSGPVAVGLVEAFTPQPPWMDAATFARHYSWLQLLPYVFGFLILGGFVAFMAGLIGIGREEQRPLEHAALAFTAVAAALIFFNYVLQTAVVPQSLSGDGAVLSLLTMAKSPFARLEPRYVRLRRLRRRNCAGCPVVREGRGAGEDPRVIERELRCQPSERRLGSCLPGLASFARGMDRRGPLESSRRRPDGHRDP
jgi:hypothetical protein